LNNAPQNNSSALPPLSAVNFQQLRSVREAIRQEFNLTDVARVLNTSQPGVSRQIRELEDELGIEIFVRAGKRLTGLTAPGVTVMPIVERMLREADNLQRAGHDFARSGVGALTIAATHSQARYALPAAVRDFRANHPGVQLHLHQGTPQQVAIMLMEGQADIGIATEALALHVELLALPCYRWTHKVVVPPGHPLDEDRLAGRALTLQRLGEFPLITYESGYTGRSHIDDAFKKADLAPDIVLVAMDADVIKTYVELGMGVGIVAAIAFDDERDHHLRAIDGRHLFAANMTRLGIRRGSYLRDYVYDFITTFAPPLTPQLVKQALVSAPGSVVED
jgi:LysR family cys regulon transcriptional activator